MVFIPIVVGLIVLILLITLFKLDTFISFMLVCLLVGLTSDLSVTETVDAIQKGIGSTLGELVIILGFGAMLGKLVAESGAGNKITNSLVQRFGIKHVQLALIVTGFIVGIPMFYNVGFVILVPLAIAVAHNTKLPLLYVGLPMLASLSVTHGFLPPHPGPTAIATMYHADLGLTLIYGIIVGIPAILSAKFFMAGTMKRIQPMLLKEYVVETDERYPIPSLLVCLSIALLPVFLIGGASLAKTYFTQNIIIEALGNPAIAMLSAVLLAVYFLGIRTGRSMTEVMKALTSAVSSIAVVLLTIAGAGAFKQIMIATEVSVQIGMVLSNLGLSPIILAFLIAAIIRVSVGSATVAGLTAGSIMMPMVAGSGVSPELLVLATGAGSITLGHINDGGFWMYKEYFNVSVKETFLTWTLMETIISIVGLLGILLLNLVV